MIPTNRQTGINALLALQGFMGMAETVAQAGEAWDMMSQQEQQDALFAYNALREAITRPTPPEMVSITHNRLFVVATDGETFIETRRVFVA